MRKDGDYPARDAAPASVRPSGRIAGREAEAVMEGKGLEECRASRRVIGREMMAVYTQLGKGIPQNRIIAKSFHPRKLTGT